MPAEIAAPRVEPGGSPNSFLKRAKYGRASTELLRARMLPFQPSIEHGV